MNHLMAAVAGASTIVVVLLLGAIARRPVRRALPSSGDRPRSIRRPAPAVGLLAGALIAGAAVAALGVFLVASVTAVVFAVRRQRRRGIMAARRRSIEVAMPNTVELLVLCIGAGCSPHQAVREVAARAPPAVRPAFADVERLLHRGQSLADALGALTPVTGALGRDVASAITSADRAGGSLAPALERLAVDARAARRRLAEADARRLPVRLTFPLVLCTLPSFLLLAIAPAVLGALSTLRVP